VSRAEIKPGSAKIVTPPSSAYWAVRLNERKRAEEALRERYAQLSRRVDQQAARLDVLSGALQQEGGENTRLQASLRGPESGWQRTDPEGSSACGTDAGVELPGRERAGEAVRADFGEMSRMVEMQAAELNEVRQTLKQEIAAREWSEVNLRRELGDLEQSITRHAAAASVDEVEGPSECQRAVEALTADFGEMSRMVEMQAAELREIRDSLKQQVAALARSEAALQETRAELAAQISQSTSGRTEAPGLSIEWRQAEQALRAVLKDLGQRVDRQTIEIRSLEESLHRRIAEGERSDAALHQMQAELEWRFGQQAARLEMVSEALGGNSGASFSRCSGRHLDGC